MTGPLPGTETSSIAVTGVGVLTPLGDGPGALFGAMRAGRVAVESVPELGGSGLARIHDFDATRYANVRGMRLYSRATRLGICATKLALADAGLDGAQAVAGESLGLVCASTFGHLETLLEYDRSLLTAGLQRTNPALMPLGLPSTPGAAIALGFGAKAFSVTVSDGGASSLDALGVAARCVSKGRARACVVVAASAHCHELALLAWRAALLAPAEGYRVLDRGSCGLALGEAAVALVLERTVDAHKRGVPARAVFRGHASSFASSGGERASALRRACASALARAELNPTEVGLWSSGANGSAADDRAEALALGELMGDRAARTPLMAAKANLGECLEASGLVEVVAALTALRERRAPPIARLEEPALPGLFYPRQEVELTTRSALVTSCSSTGACSALLLSVQDDP